MELMFSKRLKCLAKVMETCPQNPPYDFLSAAQFFWLFFSYDGYDSPGRLDQIFYPYWIKTPYEKAFAILEGMWIGFHKHRTWNICISGSNADGTDTTNEISFAILELVKKLNVPIVRYPGGNFVSGFKKINYDFC